MRNDTAHRDFPKDVSRFKTACAHLDGDTVGQLVNNNHKILSQRWDFYLFTERQLPYIVCDDYVCFIGGVKCTTLTYFVTMGVAQVMTNPTSARAEHLIGMLAQRFETQWPFVCADLLAQNDTPSVRDRLEMEGYGAILLEACAKPALEHLHLLLRACPSSGAWVERAAHRLSTLQRGVLREAVEPIAHTGQDKNFNKRWI